MATRTFALVIGILFLAIGVLGFVPALLTSPIDAPDLAVRSSYGYLFGLFPVNSVLNLVHIITGLIGIGAYRSYSSAYSFSRTTAVVYGVMTLLGLLPFSNTLFGLMPLFGHNIWFHALTAVASAYYGSRTVVDESMRTTFDQPTTTVVRTDSFGRADGVRSSGPLNNLGTVKPMTPMNPVDPLSPAERANKSTDYKDDIDRTG